ncbi:MAG: hypothetical protein CSA60_04545, partial [Neptuniibacter caesariensis]
KSIIALAVAAGSFAGIAQADGTTLYGSVRMAYEYDSKGAEVADNAGKVHKKSTSKFGDNGSRFGIKGTDDLGNGLEAFYKYENRIGDGVAKTKKLYAGLKGGFGTVSFGKQNTPRDNLTNFSDPTNQFEADYGRNAVTLSDNSAAYISPNMGGFTFAAAVVANGTPFGADATKSFEISKNSVPAAALGTTDVSNVNRHVDAYDILAQYEANGFYAGLGYQALNINSEVADNVKWRNLGLGLGYGNDQFEVGLLAEQERFKMGDDSVKPLFVRLGGLYNVTPMDAIYASVAHYNPKVDGLKKVKSGTLGYQHKFSKRTRVWAEYGHVSKKVKGGDASNKFGLGLRTDF